MGNKEQQSGSQVSEARARRLLSLEAFYLKNMHAMQRALSIPRVQI